MKQVGCHLAGVAYQGSDRTKGENSWSGDQPVLVMNSLGAARRGGVGNDSWFQAYATEDLLLGEGW